MTILCSFSIFLRALLSRGSSPPRLLLSLFLIATATFHHLPLSSSKTFPGDVEALRQLKAGIDPSSILPASCLSSWDFTAGADPCDSLFGASLFTCGFRCDDAYSSDGLARVTEIALEPAGYSGTLSPVLWDLTFLQSLEISDNRFYGSIPTPKATASLPNLRRFSLSRNAFSGDIPADVFSASKLPVLEELFLDGNRLTGTVPAGLAGMWTVKRLELQMNNISGTLPDGLVSLTNLYYLDASDNAIAGNVPSSMPPSLVEIAMRNNMLEGPLPAALGELRYLQVLDLSNNRLSGTVPGSLFANPSLQQLVLTQNHLSSLEPPPPPPSTTTQWGSTSGTSSCVLVELDLSHNDLAGTLPNWLPAIASLSALSLEGNHFSGIIPWGYAAKPFARLLLAGNYLYGPIPSPFTVAKASSPVLSLADNCLFRCPEVFFFCRGGEQKPMDLCREFNPFIP